MNISILHRSQRPAVAPFDEPPPATARGVTGIGLQTKQRLWEQMARECEAMAQLALNTGRTIPVEIVEGLDQALSAPCALGAVATRARRSSDDAPKEQAGDSTAPAAEISPLASLSVAHAALAQIIAPATPEAVALLAAERATHPLWYALGPLPIVRQMFGLATLSLFVLLGIALSEQINVFNMGSTMLTLAGYPLLVKEAYLVSAASLGTCFQNLQKINIVVSDGTYDPKFQSTYWTRWVMGVVSGLILSQLIYVFLLRSPPTEGSAVPATVGQPLLALLGGYSSDLVQGILSHTIDTVASFFRVSGGTTADNRSRARVTGRDAGEVDQDLRSVPPTAGSGTDSQRGRSEQARQ
jgi:hypothetical protein